MIVENGFWTTSFSVLQLWQADGWQRQETQRMLRPRALRDDRGEYCLVETCCSIRCNRARIVCNWRVSRDFRVDEKFPAPGNFRRERKLCFAQSFTFKGNEEERFGTVELPFKLLARSTIKFKGKRVEAVSRNQAE